jgi:transposase
MYPLDRRIVAQRIYAIVKSLRKTSYLINVHFSTISRWLRNPERKQYTYKNATKEATIIECLRFLVASNPFVSIRKLTCIICEALNIKVSRELIRLVLKKDGFTKKKAKPSFIPKHLPKRVQKFLQLRDEYIKSKRLIVSIDETSFGHNQNIYTVTEVVWDPIKRKEVVKSYKTTILFG